MNIQPLLQKLGLHAHESAIYLAILEQGQASIADIVRATKLERPTVYRWLPELLNKHLLSFAIKGKRKIYAAESPEKFLKLSEQVTKEVEQNLPDLMKLYAHSNSRPTIQFFQGDNVVQLVYEDVLATCKRGDVFYRYESPKDYKKNDQGLPPEYFYRICKRKEIQKYVITNESTAKTKQSVMERVNKYVPESYDIFNYDITQIIYKTKVAFIDFNSHTAWIITNAQFAKFQKQLFKLLFKKL